MKAITLALLSCLTFSAYAGNETKLNVYACENHVAPIQTINRSVEEIVANSKCHLITDLKTESALRAIENDNIIQSINAHHFTAGYEDKRTCDGEDEACMQQYVEGMPIDTVGYNLVLSLDQKILLQKKLSNNLNARDTNVFFKKSSKIARGDCGITFLYLENTYISVK